MRLTSAPIIRRLIGGKPLYVLDRMGYSGCFSSQALDTVSATLLSNRNRSKGSTYYAVSLYLQLGELDKARDLLRLAGRASREMKWFSMLLLFCRSNGVPYPKLSSTDEQSLDVLQERYTGSVGNEHTLLLNNVPSGLKGLFSTQNCFEVIGNAPSSYSDGCDRILLRESCVSICFNNYHLNPRIDGVADIHVVTPSWHPNEQVQGKHLVLTGNSIFYRRSKVWRRFNKRSPYVEIHTVPRQLWCSLVEQLDASPSAGLLLLSCLEKWFDVSGKDGFIAGFSDIVPTQNHSYDREPISSAHNWFAEVQVRQALLEYISKKTRTLQVKT